jgi:penicillin-binding protein 1A
MGITTDLPVVNSLVLGAGEVFPLDMASAYSTFAHRGTHIQPTAIIKVERPNGSGGYDVVPFDQPQTQPLTKQESDLVTYCLQQVVHGGTGSGAYFGKNIAGKTGTTDKNKDAWFVGYTPNGYTTAVWMGYRNAPEDGPTRYMTSVHGRVVFGGTFPATIWNKYMKAITDGMDVGSFSNPSSFPGKVINPDLTTTSSTDTTLPETSTSDTTPSSTTETTKPPKDSTTTTSEATTTTAAGDPLPN